MSISYRKKSGKYVVCKEGIYMVLTHEQVIKMEAVMKDIRKGTRVFYKEDARKS